MRGRRMTTRRKTMEMAHSRSWSRIEGCAGAKRNQARESRTHRVRKPRRYKMLFQADIIAVDLLEARDEDGLRSDAMSPKLEA